MKIRDIVKLLDAKVYCCEDRLDTEVHACCGCDMMSDVLAFVKDQAVLLTGLVNPQSIRTAEMMDIVCIVLVRGKEPDACHGRAGRRAAPAAAGHAEADVLRLRHSVQRRIAAGG